MKIKESTLRFWGFFRKQANLIFFGLLFACQLSDTLAVEPSKDYLNHFKTQQQFLKYRLLYQTQYSKQDDLEEILKEDKAFADSFPVSLDIQEAWGCPSCRWNTTSPLYRMCEYLINPDIYDCRCPDEFSFDPYSASRILLLCDHFSKNRDRTSVIGEKLRLRRPDSSSQIFKADLDCPEALHGKIADGIYCLKIDNTQPFTHLKSDYFNTIVMRAGICLCKSDTQISCGGIDFSKPEGARFLFEVVRILKKDDPQAFALLQGEVPLTRGDKCQGEDCECFDKKQNLDDLHLESLHAACCELTRLNPDLHVTMLFFDHFVSDKGKVDEYPINFYKFRLNSGVPFLKKMTYDFSNFLSIELSSDAILEKLSESDSLRSFFTQYLESQKVRVFFGIVIQPKQAQALSKQEMPSK
jgi:hypothetical protein